jgi:pimeloyl-ACP methyl ester carboxylesterase
MSAAAGWVTSADGTTIGFDQYGAGPEIILVHGGLTDKAHPVLAGVAAALAPWFTVFNYDRREPGRKRRQPALLRTARDRGPGCPPGRGRRDSDGIRRLFRRWPGPGGRGEKSGHLEAGRMGAALPPRRQRAPLPHDFAARLGALVDEGRRGDAVELFMVEAAEAPVEAVAAMRLQPSWSDAEAIARTLAYEAAVMGPGNALPAELLAAITQPVLVLNGGNSPAWMTSAGQAVARTIPAAAHRVLDGQAHNVSAEALVPELLEFFLA